MTIDLVYSYVNGNDEDWRKLRFSYSNNENDLCRFRDNNELKYSLRSVEKYLPWIHKIFIVTDSTLPEWINIDNPKLKIVTHEEFMPKEVLPCYNSNVIESYISQINDLSELYIYACDDMSVGKYIPPSFFFKDNKPIIRLLDEGKIKGSSYYEKVLLNSQKLINEKYNFKTNLRPWHNMDSYSKSFNQECFNVFKDEFVFVSKNRFRKENDIQRSLFHYYYIEKGYCFFKKYNERNAFYKLFNKLKCFIFPSIFFDSFFSDPQLFFSRKYPRIMFARKPKLICFNDSEDTTNENLEKYKQLMEKKFPEKSCFEK